MSSFSYSLNLRIISRTCSFSLLTRSGGYSLIRSYPSGNCFYTMSKCRLGAISIVRCRTVTLLFPKCLRESLDWRLRLEALRCIGFCWLTAGPVCFFYCSIVFLDGCLLFYFMGGLGGTIGLSFSFYYLLMKTLLVFITSFFSYVLSFSVSFDWAFSLGFKLTVVCDFLGNYTGFYSISSKSYPY